MAEKEGEAEPLTVVFITSIIHTHMTHVVRHSDTVADLKKNVTLVHSSCLPSFGEIMIYFVKLKHKGNLFSLSDSILVGKIIDGNKNEVFIYMEGWVVQHRVNH